MKQKRSAISLSGMGVNKKNNANLLSIEIDKLVENPYNARFYYDPNEIVNRAESLKENGQISRIIVVKHNNKYIVIDGNYRWKAAISIGWKKIDAELKDIDEKDYFKISRAANDDHQSNTVFDIARGLKLIKEKKLAKNNDELAVLAGESNRANISKLLQLNELPQAAANILALRKPKVAMTVAYESYLLWKVIKEKLPDPEDFFVNYCQSNIVNKLAGRNIIEAYKNKLNSSRNSQKQSKPAPYKEYFNSKNKSRGRLDISGLNVSMTYTATDQEQAKKIADAINKIIEEDNNV